MTRSSADTPGQRLAQARRLKNLLEAKDWTHAAVGKMIGKSGATIGRYERDEIPMPKAVSIALGAVLGVPQGYIEKGEDPPLLLRVIEDQEAFEQLLTEKEKGQGQEEQKESRPVPKGSLPPTRKKQATTKDEEEGRKGA